MTNQAQAYPALFATTDEHGADHFAEAGEYGGDLTDLDQVGKAFGVAVEDRDFDPFTGVHSYADAEGNTVLVIETAPE